MKKLLTIFGLINFVFYGFAQQIYVVDPSGSGDFNTISAAFTTLNALNGNLPDGGVIVKIKAGEVYNENPPTLTIAATAVKPVIIQRDGDGSNPVIKTQNSSDDIYVLNLSNCAYITWDGIDIDDPNPSDNEFYQAAAYISASSNIVIKNSTFSNFSRYGIYQTGTSSNNHYIANTLFFSPEFRTPRSNVYGIYVVYNASADSVVIDRNKIFNLHRSSIGPIRVARVRS
ncbi:MAG TPA: right-handed parallel beta-helix repeat-containing protein [Salinivirgaceae bacterium]|nr:right-handed parallel beta-helix repeat-containing protein [Salinivirgaceae bacterium]